MLLGIKTLLVIKVNGAIQKHHFQEHQQETFNHPQFLHLYTFPPLFFSNVTFHLKTYFKVIGFIVSSKRTIPWRQSLPALWPLPLEDTSHFRHLFQHKVLADGKKIRVAGEERQHRSHCVVIKTLSICPQALTKGLDQHPPDVVMGPQVMHSLSRREPRKDISKTLNKKTL